MWTMYACCMQIKRYAFKKYIILEIIMKYNINRKICKIHRYVIKIINKDY